MRLETAWGITLIGSNEFELKEYDSMLRDLEKATIMNMKLDLAKLNEIIIFETLEEFMNFSGYVIDDGYEVGDSFENLLGSYENFKNKIYIFNCNFGRLPSTQRKITLLHEISHFYRDKQNMFKYDRYVEDLVYKMYEEMRVDNLACHLAKQILPERELEYVSYYERSTRGYFNHVLRSIKFQEPEMWKAYLVAEGRWKPFVYPTKYSSTWSVVPTRGSTKTTFTFTANS